MPELRYAGYEMTRTNPEIRVAQEVLESLLGYCKRQKKNSLSVAEIKATIITLELEKMK